MTDSIREQVVAAFKEKADSEAKAAAGRKDKAWLDAGNMQPLARERRWRESAAALEAIPGDKWAAMADWLDRHVIGSEFLHYTGTKVVAPPEVDTDYSTTARFRAGVGKGDSWIGAETAALTFTRARLAEALKSLEAALSPKGMDSARWDRSDAAPEVDLPSRLGPSYFDAVAAAQSALASVRSAQAAMQLPPPPDFTEAPAGEFASWEALAGSAPGEDRRPAPRAFPELMRFWTQDAQQDPAAKEAFLVFGGAVLAAAAKLTGEAVPVALLDGLEHAYKQHRKRG